SGATAEVAFRETGIDASESATGRGEVSGGPAFLFRLSAKLTSLSTNSEPVPSPVIHSEEPSSARCLRRRARAVGSGRAVIPRVPEVPAVPLPCPGCRRQQLPCSGEGGPPRRHLCR